MEQSVSTLKRDKKTQFLVQITPWNQEEVAAAGKTKGDVNKSKM